MIAPDPPVAADPPKRYAAFVSYKTGADTEPARALRDALQQLARPPRRPRALEVFLDESGLPAGADLWRKLCTALDGAEYLIVLASERSAASAWVGDEIRRWLAAPAKDPRRIVLARVGGTVLWDERRGDFDHRRSTAVHPALFGVLPHRPLTVDLTDGRDSRGYRDGVLAVAALLHGTDAGTLDREDRRRRARSRRRSRVVRTVVLGAVIMLVAGAGLLKYGRLSASAERERAAQERHRAVEQQGIALSHRLVALVKAPGSGRPVQRLLFAVHAVRASATEESLATLRGLVRGDAVAYLHSEERLLRSVAVSADGSRVAAATGDGAVLVWDAATGSRLRQLSDARAAGVAWSDDGRILMVVERTERLRFYDEQGRQLGSDVPTAHRGVPTAGYRWFALSPQGTRAVVHRPDQERFTVWDRRSGQQLMEVPSDEFGARNLAFLDEHRLVAGEVLADVRDGSTRPVPRPEPPVTSASCGTIASGVHGPVGYDPTFRHYVFTKEHDMFVQPHRSELEGPPQAPEFPCIHRPERLDLVVPGAATEVDVAASGLAVVGTNRGLAILVRAEPSSLPDRRPESHRTRMAGGPPAAALHSGLLRARHRPRAPNRRRRFRAAAMSNPRPRVAVVHAQDQRELARALVRALRYSGRSRRRRIDAYLLPPAEERRTAPPAADWLLLVLSPGAVDDPQLAAVLSDWLRRRGSDALLLVHADGRVRWERGANDYSPDSAVPAELRGAFASMPAHVELGDLSGSREWSLRHAEFRDRIAKIATTVYGLASPDELDGADIRRHRRRRRLARLAAVALAVLVPTAVVLAVAAQESREQAGREQSTAQQEAENAERRREQAVGERLAHRAQDTVGPAPEVRLLLAAQGYALGARPEAESALVELLLQFGDPGRPPLGTLPEPAGEEKVRLAMDTTGGVLGVGPRHESESEGVVFYYDPQTWQRHRRDVPAFDDVLAVAPGGRRMALSSREDISAEQVSVGGKKIGCNRRFNAACHRMVLVDAESGTVRPAPPELPLAASWPPDGTTPHPFLPDVYTPDGRHLVSWRHRTGRLYLTPADRPGAPVVVPVDGPLIDFRPLDNGQVFVLTERKLTRLTVPEGRVDSTVSLDASGVTAAAVLPSGDRAVLAHSGELRLVDLTTGEVLRTADSGMPTVDLAVVSPDGSTLAISGGHTGAMVDMKTFSLRITGAWGDVGTSARFGGGPVELAFTPDSSQLVIRGLIGEGGYGSPVLVWATDAERWYDAACALAGRTLTDAEWTEYVGLGDRAPRACHPEPGAD